MNVELSDPTLAEDLLAFLQHVDCVAERDGNGRILVSLPGSPSEQAARYALEYYLAEWQESHPGVKARRKPRYDL